MHIQRRSVLGPDGVEPSQYILNLTSPAPPCKYHHTPVPVRIAPLQPHCDYCVNRSTNFLLLALEVRLPLHRGDSELSRATPLLKSNRDVDPLKLSKMERGEETYPPSARSTPIKSGYIPVCLKGLWAIEKNSSKHANNNSTPRFFYLPDRVNGTFG